MKNSITVLTLLSIQLAVSAQADTLRKGISDPLPLFQSEELIEAVIAFDIPTVLRDVGDDRKYHEALFAYIDENGDTIELEIKIRTRGNFRRNPDNCDFPPLRLDFSESQIDNTIFEGQKKLKLVSHCRTRKKYYQKYLLKEYLSYRLYNIIANESYRVRLFHFTYIDISGRKESIKKYGFILETSGKMAARNGCEEFDFPNVKQKDTNQDIMINLAFFQFMIGNTDWSVPGLHNIELIRPSPYLPPIAVPYDFDWSGLVNTNYAIPAPNLEIQSVRERLYRGICYSDEDYRNAIHFFKDKEQEIISFCNDMSYLEEKERKRITKYFKQFYFILDNPRLLESEIYSKCRTE